MSTIVKNHYLVLRNNPTDVDGDDDEHDIDDDEEDEVVADDDDDDGDDSHVPCHRHHPSYRIYVGS